MLYAKAGAPCEMQEEADLLAASAPKGAETKTVPSKPPKKKKQKSKEDPLPEEGKLKNIAPKIVMNAPLAPMA